MSYTWREITLDRTITRAIEGGFADKDFEGWDQLDEHQRLMMVRQILKHNGVGQIIFRHNFAKALWGDKPMFFCFTSDEDSGTYSVGWQATTKGANFVAQSMPMNEYHLQQMVLAPDWLKYLSDHVK